MLHASWVRLPNWLHKTEGCEMGSEGSAAQRGSKIRTTGHRERCQPVAPEGIDWADPRSAAECLRTRARDCTRMARRRSAAGDLERARTLRATSRRLLREAVRCDGLAGAQALDVRPVG